MKNEDGFESLIRRQESVPLEEDDEAKLRRLGFVVEEEMDRVVKQEEVEVTKTKDDSARERVKAIMKRARVDHPKKLEGINFGKEFRVVDHVKHFKQLDETNICSVGSTFCPKAETCEVFEKDDGTKYYIPLLDPFCLNMGNILKANAENDDRFVLRVSTDRYTAEDFYKDLKEYYYRGDLSSLRDETFAFFEQVKSIWEEQQQLIPSDDYGENFQVVSSH